METNTTQPQNTDNQNTTKNETTQKAQNTNKKKEKNNKKKENIKKKERPKKSFSWTFVLLLFFIGFAILCFINKWQLQKEFQKIKNENDSLSYQYAFYKNAYKEKDSIYNSLLSEYNNLITNKLSESKELEKSKRELLELQQLLNTKDSILTALQNSIKEALTGYNTDELSVSLKNGKLYVTMQEKLLFASGSDKIPPKGYKALKKLAKVLKKNPNIEILVEGHTDNMPLSKKNKKFEDNWDLSVARAVAVVRVLVNKYGIDPERVEAAGRSMYFPVAPNTTPQGRAKNRRIEFILYPNVENLSKIANLEK